MEGMESAVADEQCTAFANKGVTERLPGKGVSLTLV